MTTMIDEMSSKIGEQRKKAPGAYRNRSRRPQRSQQFRPNGWICAVRSEGKLELTWHKPMRLRAVLHNRSFSQKIVKGSARRFFACEVVMAVEKCPHCEAPKYKGAHVGSFSCSRFLISCESLERLGIVEEEVYGIGERHALERWAKLFDERNEHVLIAATFTDVTIKSADGLASTSKWTIYAARGDPEYRARPRK